MYTNAYLLLEVPQKVYQLHIFSQAQEHIFLLQKAFQMNKMI